MKKVAIIDLGSNSIRMNIAQISSNGASEVILQTKRTVRLSEGMGDDMNLKVTPMYRTIAALSEFNDIIKENGVSEVTAIATAAVRKAVNKDYFLGEVKNAIGFDMKVISGDMEAIYDYLGVISKLEVTDCLIIDVGGASTEIILVKNGELADKTSIPMGAVSISEQFLQERESKENIVLAINLVETYINTVKFLDDVKGLPIIGLGGTNRTIARIDMKDTEDNKILHGHEVTAAKIVEIYNAIVEKSVEERKLIPGVGEDRADIILGGLLPIVSIMKRVAAKKLVVSDSGVRDGILFEKMAETFSQILSKCKKLDNGMMELDAPPVVNIKVPQPAAPAPDVAVSPAVETPAMTTADILDEDMSAYDALFDTPIEDIAPTVEEVSEVHEELTAEEIAEKEAYEALFAPRFD